MAPQIVPNLVHVDLQLQLQAKKCRVERIHVLLKEVRTLRALGHSSSVTRVVAEDLRCFSKESCLQGTMVMNIPVELRLRPQMSYFRGAKTLIAQHSLYADNEKLALPMPTMSTRLMEVSLSIEIRFPTLHVSDTCGIANPVILVGAADPVNRMPPVPVRYDLSTLLPEDEYLAA
ncbi:hypothetical protein STCU_12046 [Strigomonas culicis]|uniref:Uncharacterized protein n=1 Tax=Strigomonas culicis TaxID=28005 RepID=S9TGC7_9TRYP|nr:hypothetical protein STCU_12046 [Strigomonas culicis]|eukprot:EPY15413.1 hypothetical protein STCU_12046 [Strigomonas culicis]